MRIFITTLIVTIVIFMFSFYSVAFLERTSLELIKLLEEVQKAVEKKDWQLAQTNLKLYSQEWEKKQVLWEILMDHAEVDHITIRLAYLKSYIQTQNLVETLAEINALYSYIEQIPKGEKLTLQNLL